jgi:hypothetical protein
MPNSSAAGAIGFDFMVVFILFDSRRFHLGALGDVCLVRWGANKVAFGAAKSQG